jgi:hypothetical protein
MDAITQLLNYCVTQPDAIIRFKRRHMCLHIKSDASYLSETKAGSRAAGYHYLSDSPTDPTKAPKPDDPPCMSNGPINILSSIMREVLASASEAELAALFHNGKESASERQCLEELGHPQPPTPMVTDNSTA